MHCFGIGWWVLPLMGFGVMILLSLTRARRGGRGWCFPARRRRARRERIQRVEEEVQILKDQLASFGVHPPYR
jgi:hypothetical protein